MTVLGGSVVQDLARNPSVLFDALEGLQDSELEPRGCSPGFGFMCSKGAFGFESRVVDI